MPGMQPLTASASPLAAAPIFAAARARPLDSLLAGGDGAPHAKQSRTAFGQGGGQATENDDEERQIPFTIAHLRMLIGTTKLSLANAHQVRLLMASNLITLTIAMTTPLASALLAAGTAYNNLTKGKKRHGEMSPHLHSCLAAMLHLTGPTIAAKNEMMQTAMNIVNEAKRQLNEMTEKSLILLTIARLCTTCRYKRMKTEAPQPAMLLVYLNWGSSEGETLIGALVTLAKQVAGAEQLYGMAPPSGYERDCQKYIDLMEGERAWSRK